MMESSYLNIPILNRGNIIHFKSHPEDEQGWSLRSNVNGGRCLSVSIQRFTRNSSHPSLRPIDKRDEAQLLVAGAGTVSQ